MSTKEKHLYYLSELKDFKVNSKDPDIRGWSVKDIDNRVIGKVDNLLVNKELGKVVYVDVEVDQAIIDAKHDPYSVVPDSQIKEFINKDGENHIIVPIGLIDLNLDDKYVYTESIDYQTFAETKRYRTGSHISRDYERHVLGSYDRRKEYLDRDRELTRTSSAYSDDELAERERLRSRETRRREENLRNEPESDIEAKIRREKAKLKYKSEDRKRGISSEETRYKDSENLSPERTLDEDSDWELDEPGFRDDTSYERKRRRKRNHDDDFYDRREFYDRDYL